jgi:very-short-patch-repair endonuclease/predicted transcriptional regulator of viral defense system
MHGEASHAAIGALAARQYGLVSRAQLAELGIGRGAIAHRLRTGWLAEVHRHVYAVGHTAPRREARWLAAVLTCGDGAVLSHRSAAALWGIASVEGGHVDVSVGRERRVRRPGIAVHHALLVPADRVARLAIPVTSPARTLVDFAHDEDERRVARALREAQHLRIFDVAATRAALERRPSRVLSALLADLAVTDSILEDDLLRLCDRHGIPRPATQQWLLGRRVDFLWPRERVVVETDGWQGHGTPRAFQADRAATNALLLAGYVVLRFTHADVLRRPGEVARQIRAALGR